jgi:hypothetical protein
MAAGKALQDHDVAPRRGLEVIQKATTQTQTGKNAKTHTHTTLGDNGTESAGGALTQEPGRHGHVVSPQSPQSSPSPTPRVLEKVTSKLSESSSNQIQDLQTRHDESTSSFPSPVLEPPSSTTANSFAATPAVSLSASPSIAASVHPTLPSPPTSVSRASSTPRSKFDAERSTIIHSLREKSYQKDSPGLQFAPAGTAKDVLSDETLRKLMEEELGTEKTRQLIHQINRRSLHNIVAILIHARWNTSDLARLESHYGQPDPVSPAPITLPFTRKKAMELFDEDCGASFYEVQDIYLPLTIVEGQRNECGGHLSHSRRLPIVYTEKIAGGTSGDVFKVQIAKGGWQSTDGITNREEKWVAQKIFNKESFEDRKDMFDWEVRIYNILQRTTHYNNLAEFYGSLQWNKEGDIEYSIFLPLADSSLHTLLTSQEWYEKAADGTPKYAGDLFRCAAGLCDGVYTLHHLLRDNDEKPISVLHMDLKPKNVLIYRGTSHAKTHWKIADYGLSRDKPRQDNLDNTIPLQREGTFVSPEAHLGKKVTIVSDLWCLAGVLLEVYTYVLGGPELVKKFRAFRTVTRGRITEDQFFVSGDEDDGQVVTKPEIARWCDKLRTIAYSEGQAYGEIIGDALTFLEQKVLLIDVEERGKTQANTIRDQLFDISIRLNALASRPAEITSTALVETPGVTNTSANELGQESAVILPRRSKLRRLFSLSEMKRWGKRNWHRA